MVEVGVESKGWVGVFKDWGAKERRRKVEEDGEKGWEEREIHEIGKELYKITMQRMQ